MRGVVSVHEFRVSRLFLTNLQFYSLMDIVDALEFMPLFKFKLICVYCKVENNLARGLIEKIKIKMLGLWGNCFRNELFSGDNSKDDRLAGFRRR